MKNSLSDFLTSHEPNAQLRALILEIAECAKEIAQLIRTGNPEKAGTANTFGEEQLALDIASDQLVLKKLMDSKIVSEAVSEEQEEIIQFQDKGMAVAYDPLDGSSLIDVNLSVGSIFGIFPEAGFIGKTGAKQIAAAYAVYGPRLTFVFATQKIGLCEFALNEKGDFELLRENITLKPQAKLFGPGNLRGAAENAGYQKALKYWEEQEYTLRYSGGMVPDINLILLKEGGIFIYPPHSKYPQGKLRLLYECAPFAFLAERASGQALTDQGKRVLDIEITNLDQRTPIFVGSTEEVNKIVGFFKKD